MAIFIKLVDRLHNMRTLDFMPEDKQITIANETKEKYCPIAFRLGMYEIYWELLDLSCKYLEKEIYMKGSKLANKMNRDVDEVCNSLKNSLDEGGVKAEVVAEHIYPINAYENRERPPEHGLCVLVDDPDRINDARDVTDRWGNSEGELNEDTFLHYVYTFKADDGSSVMFQILPKEMYNRSKEKLVISLNTRLVQNEYRSAGEVIEDRIRIGKILNTVSAHRTS